MDGETEKFWTASDDRGKQGLFSSAGFPAVRNALQRRILRWAAGRLSGEAAVFDYEENREVPQASAAGTDRKQNLCGGHHGGDFLRRSPVLSGKHPQPP